MMEPALSVLGLVVAVQLTFCAWAVEGVSSHTAQTAMSASAVCRMR